MRRVAGAMLLSMVVWLVLLSTIAPAAQAQSPEASPTGVIGTGDPRSDGEGPGLVGSPVEIALGVMVLGLVTIVGTTLVLRLRR